MPSNPPTRRSRRTPSGEPSLPIIPILIGVIVLGFVIGAGLSLAGRHDLAVVALASPSAASETLAPVTPAPSEKPTPEPTPAPVQLSGAPTASESATPRPVVVTTPRARPAQRATPAAIAARATPVRPAAVVAAASPATEAIRPADPATERAAPPAAATSNASVASSGKSASNASNADVVEADSAFAKLSAAVVRQYIEAVKRGDQDGAYAALGTTAGAKDATLTEEGVVDSQTRVGRIDAHAAANDNALVSVQLQTANGPYYGNFTVHKTDTGAAVIVAHSIVKP